MKTGNAGVYASHGRVYVGHKAMACRCGLLGVSLLCAASLHAQSDPNNTSAASNQSVLEQWNSKAPEDTKAALVTDETGQSKLVFNGGVNLDAYHNKVNSATGKVGSALQQGNLYKAQADFEVRSETKDGGTTYLQTAVAAANDRSALPRYNWQMTNFQIGHREKNYELQLGDVGINYSTLGANIGFKGARVQMALGSVTSQLFVGSVAESWDALSNRAAIDGQPPRQKFLTEVKGTKIEWQATPAFKAFATLQSRMDQESTLSSGVTATPGSDALAYSVGMGWQGESFTVQSELSGSKLTPTRGDTKTGQAFIADGTWRFDKVSTRFGYHKIGGQFATLGGGAQPGIEELYTSADWQTSDWLQLGIDWRESKQRIDGVTIQPPPTAQPTDPGAPAPLPISPIQVTPPASSNTQAETLRANFNLQSLLAGASVALSHGRTVASDASNIPTRSDNSMWQLGLQRERWGGTYAYSVGNSRNAFNNAADSHMNQQQLSLQWRPWVSTADMPAEWNGSIGLNVSDQKQKLLLAEKTNSTKSAGLSFNLQHPKYGSGIFSHQQGTTYQTGLSQKLIQRATQLEWNKTLQAISDKAQLKIFVRRNGRNVNDEATKVNEDVYGTTFNVRF